MTGFMIVIIGVLLAQPIIRLWERAMTKNRLDDPAYRKNVRELIERNRKVEDAKE